MKHGDLYKIKKEGKIAGVCAGVAEYFGIEAWLVRILTVTAFLLLAGPFIFVVYVALWFILDDKAVSVSKTSTQNVGPSHKGYVNGAHDVSSKTSTHSTKGYKNNSAEHTHKVEVKSKVWQSGLPPRQAFMDIKVQYESIENKLRKLESYVTSKEFQLNQELNRL